MSTPRRDCPRSSGTPMIRIFLGTSTCCSGLVAGLVAIFVILTSYCCCHPERRRPALGRRSRSTPLAARICTVFTTPLRIQPVQRARERNRLAHVIEPADPRHRTLDAHAKPRVRNPTELAQIKVPLESLFRQFVL